MDKSFGIVHTEEGRYIMAAMNRDEAGTWSLDSYRQWESNSVLHRILLFDRGVYFGIPSWWIPGKSDISFDNMIAVETENFATDKSIADNIYNVVTYSKDLCIHKETLKDNLLAVVPDNAFLATLPLSKSEVTNDSFISIYGNGELYIIGIIVKTKLKASFKMAPGDHKNLPGHIGRIKRYWYIKFPNVIFPEDIVYIGDFVYTPENIFNKHPIKVHDSINDINLLKAMGIALAQRYEAVPMFSAQTQEALFRKTRTWIYRISAGLFITGVVAVLVFHGINLLFLNKQAKYKREYQHVIAHNLEIKKLTERVNELAVSVTRLEETFLGQTIWAKFLYAIGKKAPKDLYFERFGSKPVEKENNAVQIALYGWSPRESSITQFIAALQDMQFVTQITLSSMERDKKEHSIYGFKILCTLLLNEQ